MRIVVSMSSGLKETGVIRAVSTVAGVQSLTLDDAIHPIDHRLGTSSRITAAAHASLNPPEGVMDPTSVEDERESRLGPPPGKSFEQSTNGDSALGSICAPRIGRRPKPP